MHTARSALLVLGACLALPFLSTAQDDSLSTIVLRPLHEDHPGVLKRIVPEPPLERPKIGLVLSGGGARGMAQVGVLKALERARVRHARIAELKCRVQIALVHFRSTKRRKVNHGPVIEE